jgi:hypothetical protein
MNLGELIDAAQHDLADTKGSDAKRLISRGEWVRYAVDGENEACRRARLILDSTTQAICRPEVAEGEPLVTLDARVLWVRRVSLDSTGRPLSKSRSDLLDLQRPGWEDETGEVTHFLQDYETGKLRLFRIPEAADVLRLSVYRLPLRPMRENEDAPEIRAQWHERLVNYMLFKAYSKQDVELVRDLPRATAHLGLFEQEFGPKRSAKDEAFNEAMQGLDTLEGYA